MWRKMYPPAVMQLKICLKTKDYSILFPKVETCIRGKNPSAGGTQWADSEEVSQSEMSSVHFPPRI